MKDEVRNLYDNEQKNSELFVCHFESLFGTTIDVYVDPVIAKVKPRVESSMITMLTTTYSGEEVL